MFDLDQFVADCRAALAADRTHNLVHEVVVPAVSDPADILRELGEPRRAQLQRFITRRTKPSSTRFGRRRWPFLPHDHRLWAVIRLYTGRVDNIFWRRIKGDPYGRMEAVGARALW